MSALALRPTFAWLEITGFCNLNCRHCYADSSPQGDHGDMTDADWFRGNDRLHEKLNALGVEHTCDLTTQAGGHSWDYFSHMAERAIRFVYNGLEQESRRLL